MGCPETDGPFSLETCSCGQTHTHFFRPVPTRIRVYEKQTPEAFLPFPCPLRRHAIDMLAALSDRRFHKNSLCNKTSEPAHPTFHTLHLPLLHHKELHVDIKHWNKEAFLPIYRYSLPEEFTYLLLFYIFF